MLNVEGLRIHGASSPTIVDPKWGMTNWPCYSVFIRGSPHPACGQHVARWQRLASWHLKRTDRRRFQRQRIDIRFSVRARNSRRPRVRGLHARAPGVREVCRPLANRLSNPRRGRLVLPAVAQHSRFTICIGVRSENSIGSRLYGHRFQKLPTASSSPDKCRTRTYRHHVGNSRR